MTKKRPSSVRPIGLLPAFFLSAVLAGGCESAPPESTPALEELGIKNLRQPMPGIVTGGQLTEEQLRQLARLGYRDVINLRPLGEEGTGWEEAVAAELGVRFVRLPVAGAEGLSVDNARRLGEELKRAEGRGAVVYCGSGNRVGALMALEAHFVGGKSAEEALAIGKAAGVTRLEPKVRELLGL